MSKNIQLICRVCLRKCKSRHVSLLEVFPINAEQASVTYAEAYKNCTQLEVEIGVDGLPEWLCNSCSRDLQYSYDFWIKAKKSADTLLTQIRAQNEENARRVPSPSEFELPDSGALGYALADGDIIDACSTQVMKCDKDPLEESDSDNEVIAGIATTINKLESPTLSQTYSDFIYDSEDEKPLKLLMTGNQTEVGNAIEKDQCSFDEDDEFIAEENTTKEKIADPMFTPEAHIFPKGRFKCAICEQRYFTAAGLKAHMEVHLAKSGTTKKKRGRNKQRKAPKKVINDEDYENSSLNPTNADEKHANEEAKDQEEQHSPEKSLKSKKPKPKRMFPCHVCGKHMISASKLRYHMVMHTGEKDYLCTMCPKAYSTIYALKHHIRTHTGERPYECKFCGDRFLRPTTLKSHQRRHTGERPYGCDICGKRFIQHSSMTTHMKLNHMDKTIQCPHCDKKYARQTDLNTHLLSHTGDKPYSCQLCPSRFVRQANLNKHMNQQHAEKASVSKFSQLTDVTYVAACGSVAVAGKSKVCTVYKLTDKSMLSEAVASDFVDKCYNFNSFLLHLPSSRRLYSCSAVSVPLKKINNLSNNSSAGYASEMR
ncbi:PREDICTED: zinc finger protein 569-like isoform X2 [Bactrocera latifrons]|uniref:zinc finger protein 569-like isoform X2 n=1 Tax=Bactrocera latifrons TaxID=174628 RepID=UPI0008DD04A7|nr:PREDICTED: zinc finger protein 569-like isoform X2 [Bactrocera latifrons]